MRVGRPVAAVALLVLALTVGCSGNPESATSTKPGSSAAAATDPPNATSPATVNVQTSAPGTTGTAPSLTADQQAVTDAHDKAINAIDTARADDDPNDPALAAVLAHDMLRDVRIDIEMRKSQGMAVRLPPGTKSRIDYVLVHLDGANATLQTCEVDDRIVYRTADQSVVNDAVTTGRWSVSLVLDSGTWKLAGRQRQQSWQGEEMSQCLGAS